MGKKQHVSVIRDCEPKHVARLVFRKGYRFLIIAFSFTCIYQVQGYKDGYTHYADCGANKQANLSTVDSEIFV